MKELAEGKGDMLLSYGGYNGHLIRYGLYHQIFPDYPVLLINLCAQLQLNFDNVVLVSSDSNRFQHSQRFSFPIPSQMIKRKDWKP